MAHRLLNFSPDNSILVRWDPDRTGVFFDQSAVLQALCYNLRMTVRLPLA